jgi:hypothetical protein
MTIVNDDSRVVNELEASLTDDARVVIYDRYMFIVQAISLYLKYSRFGLQLMLNPFQMMLQCMCALSLGVYYNLYEWDRVKTLLVLCLSVPNAIKHFLL